MATMKYRDLQDDDCFQITIEVRIVTVNGRRMMVPVGSKNGVEIPEFVVRQALSNFDLDRSAFVFTGIGDFHIDEFENALIDEGVETGHLFEADFHDMWHSAAKKVGSYHPVKCAEYIANHYI